MTLTAMEPTPVTTTPRRGRSLSDLYHQRLETALIIEDDPDLNSIVSARLRRGGFMVASALDGAKGLELVRLVRPDVIILDLALPRMDGARVLHNLRFAPGLRRVPVIVITGTQNEGLIRTAEHWGAHSVLRKPLNTRELLEVAIDAIEGLETEPS